MKIEVWSDFVCPFCYIGKKRLENVLEEMDLEADIIMKSYELDPVNHPDPSLNIYEQLAQKYGISVEQAKGNNERIALMAKEEGLEFNFDTMKNANTFSAHKVYQYAKEIGKEKEVADLFFNAVFEAGVYLDSTENIIEVLKPLGIEDEVIYDVIGNDEYGFKVRTDEQEAYNLGVQGVPYFRIDDKVVISGARSAEDFKQALSYVNLQQKSNEDLCTDEGCNI